MFLLKQSLRPDVMEAEVQAVGESGHLLFEGMENLVDKLIFEMREM